MENRFEILRIDNGLYNKLSSVRNANERQESGAGY